MESLTYKDIKNHEIFPKRKTISVMKGSGVSLIIESKGCKRLEGVIRSPIDKKLQHIPLGVVCVDIKSQKNMNKLFKEWDDLKDWGKETKKKPQDFFKRNETPESQMKLSELFEKYLEHYEKISKPRTFKDRKNKFNQILKFFGDDYSLSDYEWDKGGRELVGTLIKSLKSRNRHNHCMRVRSLMGQCFEWGIRQGIFPRRQNPCSEPFDIEKVGYKPKQNPCIRWDEVPELFEKINSSTNSIITKSSLNLYLMTCIRVSVIVSMKWNWINEEENMIVVPPDTEGLKRTLNRSENPEYEHYIPLTDEMKLILNTLKDISGHQEYVFWTPDCKKLPHQHPESLNRYLNRLGYKDKLTCHGWRRVVVTEGQQICETDRDIIERQIGHTGHKSGSIGCYDNTQFLPERRIFLERWCKELVRQGMKL